ncbi:MULTISPECIES: hypothetical protein [unclassified Microbacterium]|uniref:hypothetical protein n=1 Tax=unclassified Microbacterium TaxID=2609290 RepID=UPI001AD456EE|nr:MULTISPECIES: hypothetical protein [unclassified Microbacterium]MBN9225455.1 hypothetical protein [Microbacterium sp.]
MNVPTIRKTLATVVVALAAFGFGSWFATQANRSTADHGVASVLAIVAQTPHAAVVGDINFLAITPEDKSSGRVSVWAAVGAPGKGDDAPTSVLPSRTESADVDPTSEKRQGLTFLVGGAAGSDFSTCAPAGEVKVWTDIVYDDLSAPEQAAAVESVRVQMLDREAQYGQFASDSLPSAVDTAAALTYTLIEPIELEPQVWRMESAPAADATSKTDEASDDTETIGHSAYFQCDVSFSSMWSSQSWGSRFELPALVVAAPASTSVTHVESRIGVFRSRELASYIYSSSEGLDGADVSENWSGLDGRRTVESQFSTAEPLASAPDVTLAYAGSLPSSLRDATLFFAGVMFSLSASLIVAAVRQSMARRDARGSS